MKAFNEIQMFTIIYLQFTIECILLNVIMYTQIRIINKYPLHKNGIKIKPNI